jgi:asparagine synthetase B (glutamine-hydrolysing)
MSAIVGILHTDHQAVCLDVLDAILAALAHRGPDGAGRWHAGLGLTLSRPFHEYICHFFALDSAQSPTATSVSLPSL